jgi:hypothetical protein
MVAKRPSVNENAADHSLMVQTSRAVPGNSGWLAPPLVFLTIMFAFAPALVAQNPTQRVSDLPTVGPGFLTAMGAAARFDRHDILSGAQNTDAIRLQVQSVPAWQSSFSYAGTTYPYVMVGKPPSSPGTSRIDVDLIPVEVVFDNILDASGEPLVFDPEPIVPQVTTSPLFAEASYPNGFTQYVDAIQRANFPSAPDNWHTLLNHPHVEKTVVVHVTAPANGAVFKTAQGTPFALVELNYLTSQAFAALPSHLQVARLVAWVVPNVFLFDTSLENCCYLGFHDAQSFQDPGGAVSVFTYAFADWLDPDVSDATYGFPFGADVMPLSHEIAEWIDDPFVSNFVSAWPVPFFGCFPLSEEVLVEVGDPIATFFAAAPFSLTVNGFTYHPTNIALLPWFTRELPSSAFGGAYSFPQPLLTSPAGVCP